MDPNVTYSSLTWLVTRIELDLLPLSAHLEAIELITDHATDLAAWLDRGGFAPRDLDPQWRTRTAEALAKIGYAPVAVDF